MKYELTKELETGNSIIDSEHRELFAAINRLMDACSVGKGRSTLVPTLDFLEKYVDTHFAHEEQLQQQNKYPDYSAHRTFHENFKRKLHEISAEIPSAGPTLKDMSALNMHIGTLISHIRIDDKKLGAFLKSKMCAGSHRRPAAAQDVPPSAAGTCCMAPCNHEYARA